MHVSRVGEKRKVFPQPKATATATTAKCEVADKCPKGERTLPTCMPPHGGVARALSSSHFKEPEKHPKAMLQKMRYSVGIKLQSLRITKLVQYLMNS